MTHLSETCLTAGCPFSRGHIGGCATVKKLAVFIAVPSSVSGCYDFWCELRRHDDHRPGTWHVALSSSTLELARDGGFLLDSMRYRDRTEYALAVLTSRDGSWYMREEHYCPGKKVLFLAAMLARAVTCFTNEQVVPVPKAAEPQAPAPLAPQPPLEKKEDPPVLCSFCEKPAATVTDGVTSQVGAECVDHLLAGASHRARLRTGGAVDCPETRAETLRFLAHERAQIDLAAAQLSGFRTQRDASPGAKPSLTECAAPAAEAIPLVGMTPHYEWP